MSDRGVVSYEALNELIRSCLLWLAAVKLFDCSDPLGS